MPRIVISYRRADSDAITGRIFDRLIAHYGRNSVFRDVDNIPLGVDFRNHIAAVLDESNVVLVVVGPRWIGGRGAGSRLGNPADPVRIEVETALRKGIPVIPILVGRVGMPKLEQLPDSMKDFAYRNGLRVDTGADFDHHIDRLIRATDAIFADKRPIGGTTSRDEGPSIDTSAHTEGILGMVVRPSDATKEQSDVIERVSATVSPSKHSVEPRAPIPLGSTGDRSTSDEAETVPPPVRPEPDRTVYETMPAAQELSAASSLGDRERSTRSDGCLELTGMFFNFTDEFTAWAYRELREKFGVTISTAAQARGELRIRGYRVKHSLLAGHYFVEKPPPGRS